MLGAPGPYAWPATSSQTHIRLAEPADAPAVLALWREEGVAPGSTDTEEALVALLDHDANAVLVAQSQGRIVGVLIAAWDGWRGNMYRLAVHPDLRGEGIARTLIEEGERRLRDRGARRVTCLVNDDDSARVVWRTLGYEPDPRVNRHVKTLT